uniref:TSA: Wollemia nobilis Ref_Wollemi_Transcript_876_1198 transcribed RNA sequence n=1 Tax=Wollemia nobilis TaxID=56998 RepID=A0A0C9RZC6_9CONI
MAIAAASLLSSSTQCPRERISFRKTGWALGNQRFSDHNCMKRSLLHPSVRRNSSRVYPRLQATFNTVNAAITADKLNQEIGCLGVKAEEGEGKLAKLVLKSSGGSEVEIYLFGGCISSWKTSKGKDLLFVRPDAVFNGQKPISGGIPHCFPQFGPGPMQQASVTGASVKGLKGCKTLNKFPDPLNPIESLEEREVVNFPGFVDCVYLGAPEKLLLENGLGDTISVENKNWEDAVLWNPHMQMEACYKDFVCVENAKIGKVELQPGQTWTGEQYLSAS